MVSIIIPVYNVQEYLPECMDSICRQDYKDIEILVVDDGSTDASGEICDKYADMDSRIKVIHQENRGLSGARNTALNVAQGEYYMFIDSDDYVAPDYVSSMVSAIEQDDDIDMVLCRYYNDREQEDGTYLSQECVTQPEKFCLTGTEVLTKRFGTYKVYYVVAWNKIYKRKLFDTLRFPEGRISEDAWISLDLYRAAQKVVCITKPLYYYRNRKGSISQTISEEWIKAQLEWLAHEIEYFLQSQTPADLIYPAGVYASVVYKNRQFGILQEEKKLYSIWTIAIKSLLTDGRVSFWNKCKYLYYWLVCKKK